MKAKIIARVSTEEQREAGNSLPAQITRMETYCKRYDFIITDSFSFDESAYKVKREEFDAILESIINTKEKIAVCFDKVDRFSRNIFDKRVAVLYEMAVADKIELHFVSDGQVINSNMNAGDKFAFGMKLGLSKYYSDAISDNVKRALEQKRRNGEWASKAPIGYLNATDPISKKKYVMVNPNNSHLIQLIFTLYATGNYSMETIRTMVTEQGLRSDKGFKLSKSMIEHILGNSFYCGYAVTKTIGRYPHKYPRLIEEDLWNTCNEKRLGKRTKPCNDTRKNFIFGGLLNCALCGCSLSPEIKKGRLIYYSCTNSKKICKRIYVPEKILLDRVYEILEAFEGISEDVQETLLIQLRENTEAGVEYHKNQVERIQSEYKKIKDKDNNLLEMRLENDSSITKEVYDKKHQEYYDKLQQLNIELEEHTKANHDYQNTISMVFSLCRRAKAIFDSSEPNEKRAFINYLFQNPTVNEKTPCFAMRSPFNLVLELSSSPIGLRG
jgi:site-specific DNA recombinase